MKKTEYPYLIPLTDEPFDNRSFLLHDCSFTPIEEIPFKPGYRPVVTFQGKKIGVAVSASNTGCVYIVEHTFLELEESVFEKFTVPADRLFHKKGGFCDYITETTAHIFLYHMNPQVVLEVVEGVLNATIIYSPVSSSERITIGPREIFIKSEMLEKE